MKAKRMTREEFVAYVNGQMGTKPFPWYPVPCDCEYEGCHGWRVLLNREDAVH